ncbi:ATP-binding protein [Polyangium sp. y55x31]|uniref:ATP-binding protein n=1 Tax=Polyangium sp. y55x31 TaxID=3042688 RepID=UPI002482F9F1|nr:ATP-binding protein [Polyangium sp. y55x31]MDI1477712.1 ATP-binding protein [Polyangium sp. y55x31]
MATARSAPDSSPLGTPPAEQSAHAGPFTRTHIDLAAARAGGIARGGVREGELCFLGSLHELVAIGLYRPALSALVSGTGTPARPPMDRAYLLKILDEEVGRQFGHPLRPVVELVLNAIDATPEHPARVDVRVREGVVTVTDDGIGMDLRTILSRLLVPFATDKRPGVDLGRFGVGFFSVIGLGLPDPATLSIEVETGDGASGWSLSVLADGPEPSSLICAIRRLTPRAGTRVQVRSLLVEAEPLRAYLRDALHFFPKERAIVNLDGVPLNDGRYLAGGSHFTDALSPEDPSRVARFYVGGRSLVTGICAATYHAGVKVEGCLAIPELALIDFPSAVELTEGRDALKPCRNFRATAAAFYRRLVDLSRVPGTTRKTADRLAEVAAQISALMLQSAAWNEVAPELSRALLGPDRYLVGPERREPLIGFLGSNVESRLFVPESFWAEREWQGFIPGERELLARELEIDHAESLSSLARRRPDLPGIVELAHRAERPEAVPVALARGRKSAPGPLPCLGTRHALLVREDAPAVARRVGWAEQYALRVAFDRATGMREPDLERELIVSEPIGVTGSA